MKKRIRLLMLLTVFISGCDRHASDKADMSKYFPLKVGNQLVYTFPNNNNITIKDEVVEYSSKYNAYLVKRVGKFQSSPPQTTSVVLIAVKNDAVLKLAWSNYPSLKLEFSNIPRAILQAPLTVGKTWGMTDAEGNEFRYKIIGFVNHKVKAGDFQDVCKVEEVVSFTLDGRYHSGVDHLYYAPRVGLIDDVVVQSLRPEEEKQKVPYSLFQLSEYKLTQDNQQAINDFDSTVNLNPNDAVAYFKRGTNSGALGNYQQAINDFNKAIELNPKYSEAYNNRGFDYGALGNYKQALNDLSKAIELNPEFVRAFYNRGIIYGEMKNYQQAINDYNKAIELDPKYAAAYVNRGSDYAALGNYPQALNDLNKAIELNPNYAEAYYNRGSVYGALGSHQRAINDYSKAIQINPKYVNAYNNRAVAYKKLGNKKMFIENVQMAAQLGDKYAQQFLNSRGIQWQ